MRPPATREPREPEAARTTRRDSENEGDRDIPHPREPSPRSYKHHLHVLRGSATRSRLPAGRPRPARDSPPSAQCGWKRLTLHGRRAAT